jgi:hypothetical protein
VMADEPGATGDEDTSAGDFVDHELISVMAVFTAWAM